MSNTLSNKLKTTACEIADVAKQSPLLDEIWKVDEKVKLLNDKVKILADSLKSVLPCPITSNPVNLKEASGPKSAVILKLSEIEDALDNITDFVHTLTHTHQA